MINHLKFLWNGGLDPDTASLISLRERRTLSTTVFCVMPLVIILIVSNTFTGGERDNIYIISASVNGFLTKPFHQSDLREVLLGALQRLRLTSSPDQYFS